MIRTVFVPENENFVFSVPKEYVGKRVEITMLPTDDLLVEYVTPRKKKVSFTSVNLDTRGWKFDREEANAR